MNFPAILIILQCCHFRRARDFLLADRASKYSAPARRSCREALIGQGFAQRRLPVRHPPECRNWKKRRLERNKLDGVCAGRQFMKLAFCRSVLQNE